MMHLDGAALEFGGLEGGDLAIGSSFVVEVVRADEQRLTATVRLVNGRLECRELHLRMEHGQIDDRALHEWVWRPFFSRPRPTLQGVLANRGRTRDRPEPLDARVVASDLTWAISGAPLLCHPWWEGGSGTARCHIQRSARGQARAPA
jgi:hypothetical protein